MARGKFNPLQLIFSTFVNSQTNAGSAGGTMYYINLGGIKLLWGTTGSITNNSAGPNFGVTFPSGFFTTIQASVASFNVLNTTSTQIANWNGINATSGTLTVYANATTSSGEIVGYIVIGT